MLSCTSLCTCCSLCPHSQLPSSFEALTGSVSSRKPSWKPQDGPLLVSARPRRVPIRAIVTAKPPTHLQPPAQRSRSAGRQALTLLWDLHTYAPTPTSALPAHRHAYSMCVCALVGSAWKGRPVVWMSPRGDSVLSQTVSGSAFEKKGIRTEGRAWVSRRPLCRTGWARHQKIGVVDSSYLGGPQ